MSKLKEAAQQALGALSKSTPDPRMGDDDYCRIGWKEHADAVQALHDALAEPTIKESKTVGPYLLNGMRFKMNFDGEGTVFCFRNFFDELQGKWVALVAADDDCHMKPEPTGERAELIARLRDYDEDDNNKQAMSDAADMLEADGKSCAQTMRMEDAR
jgi:hypothetical protein